VVKGAEQRYTRAWGLEKRDPAEAAYWYALAASDGEAKALTNLGIIVARGFGTTKPDPVDAMLLWHAAAARGEVQSRRALRTRHRPIGRSRQGAQLVPTRRCPQSPGRARR